MMSSIYILVSNNADNLNWVCVFSMGCKRTLKNKEGNIVDRYFDNMGKEIWGIFFWQHRLCEVVRLHGWVHQAHQFGFGNVQRIRQVKNTRVVKSFAKLKKGRLRFRRKLTSLSTGYRFPLMVRAPRVFDRRAFAQKKDWSADRFNSRALSNHFGVCCAISLLPLSYVYFCCHHNNTICSNPPFSFLGKSWMPNLRTNTARALW